jgi:hypothetical protein
LIGGYFFDEEVVIALFEQAADAWEVVGEIDAGLCVRGEVLSRSHGGG